MRVARRRVLILAACWTSAAGAATTPTTVRLASNEFALGQEVASQLIRDIYSRAGLVASINPVPGKRSAVLVQNEEMDGEVGRIPLYGTQHPALVRVDPAFYSLTTGVFVKAGFRTQIRSPADLANFRVGIVRGITHAEHAVADLKNVVLLSKYEQLYQMIALGRIDVGIDTGLSGDAVIRRLGLEGQVVHQGDIARLELHNFLGPGHADLAPRIGRVIQAMRDSGELEALTRKYEKQTLEARSKPASGVEPERHAVEPAR